MSKPNQDWRDAPCRKCKASLMTWWRFCPACGSAIDQAPTVALRSRLWSRTEEAISILYASPRPMYAGEIGAELWKNRTGHIVASGGGGDYAAQMLLGRMRASGLVCVAPSDGSSTWELTGRGRDAAELINRIAELADHPDIDGSATERELAALLRRKRKKDQ